MARTPKPLPTLEWLQPRLRVTRALSLFSFLGLMALLVIGTAMAYEGKPLWALLSVQLLPLLVMLPGILLGNARGHAWALFVINLYFIQGVLTLFHPDLRLFGLLECSITLLFFCSAMMYTRYRFQYNRRLAGES